MKLGKEKGTHDEGKEPITCLQNLEKWIQDTQIQKEKNEIFMIDRCHNLHNVQEGQIIRNTKLLR